MGKLRRYIDRMKTFLKSLFLAALAAPVFADGEPAGEFDYYVLSLSWTPTWCSLDGDARGSPQCDADTGFGFTLHGLWPQYESGWPSYCTSVQRDPSLSQTDDMVDIMGSGGLAWHEWKKHGRCSGLSSDEYFAAARRAYNAINRPEVFRRMDQTYHVSAGLVEDAFLEANPTLEPDQITITCKHGFIQEARICLTKDLIPRNCSAEVARDCSLRDAEIAPLR